MTTKVNYTKTLWLLFISLLWANMIIGQQSDMVGQLPKAPKFNGTKSGPVLFDQISDPSEGFMASHHFTVTEKSKTCAAADDFDVPQGESWDVYSVGILGSYWSDEPGGGDTLNLYITADDNGIPGDTIVALFAHTDFYKEEEMVGNFVTTYFDINLTEVTTFTEGKYWVSCQMYSDQTVTGQWGWSDHNYDVSIYGEEWHWINPKNGWEMGATNWTPASVVVGPWLLWELAFAIYGQPNMDDLEAIEILSPEDYYYGPPAEDKEVTVMIQNKGENVQTGFDLTYTFNGNEVIENIGNVVLETNDYYEFTFTEKIDLSNPGNYELEVSVVLEGDEVPENNSLSMDITVFDPTVHLMPSMEVTDLTICSGTFTDAGGLEGDLTVDDWGILTIYPATAGAKMRLDFVQFDIGWSEFWIYDGENTLAPLLGYYEDIISPGTIIAGYQNTTGALTIHFNAQGWTPFESPGWAANVSCHVPLEDDFVLMDLYVSHPVITEYDFVTVSAQVKNMGTTILDKELTFTANGVEFATAFTGEVTQSDTVIVDVIWNPETEGDYEIVASLEEDMSMENNSYAINEHVYPFSYFCEGFELETFPPDGWSQSGLAWTHHDYAPAVGEGHAYLWAEYGLFDTLITPKLHMEEGDMISFYAYSSAWWPGELDLAWIDGETGEASLIQEVVLPFMWYQYFEIDVSDAAGDNYLAFVGKYNPMGGQGEVKLDEVCGIGIDKFFFEDDLKAYALSGNITPVEDVQTSFDVEIKNIGSVPQEGEAYEIKLMQEPSTELATYPGLDINPKQDITFTFDYTFPYAGLYNCYVEISFVDDQDPDNNFSSPLNVYVQQDGTQQVDIGTGNDYESNWYHPIITHPTGMYSQTLYLAEDVGEPNTITGIMYYYQLDENYPVYDIPLTMWMSETEETNMADSLEAANNYNLVYEGSVDFYPGRHGVYIPLDFVYPYQGGNLMVTTFKYFSDEYLGISNICVTNTDEIMVRYFNGYSNGYELDPYDQSTLDSLYLHQKTQFANARFFKFNLEGQYCTPQIMNGTNAGDYIDGVTFNEIENLGTGGLGGPAYNNYTSISSNLQRGRTYELTVQAESSTLSNSVAAWIDFNGNNELDDEGERVMHMRSDESSQEFTVQVTVPEDAALGITILRIRNSADQELFASCQAVDYGETEDYGINIIETIQLYNPVPEFEVTLMDEGEVSMNWTVPENPGITHTEGFEMSMWPPAGWAVKQSTSLDGPLMDPTGETWTQYNEDIQYVYNGAYSALVPETALDFNWLITPEVQLYGNDEISFMMNYNSDASGYSRFYVLVESEGEWNIVLEYTEEVTMSNNFDEMVTADLSDYAGKVVRIAFVSEYNDAYPIAIDDAILRGVMASDKGVSEISSYEITRNGEFFASIDDASITQTGDLLTSTENYIYCISVMYDDNEKSEELCDDAFYLAPLTPPLNVIASADNNVANVQWTAPDGGMMRFSDGFEDYNANQQVACQNPGDWSTWTLEPCSENDPFITTDMPYTGEQSVVIEGMADLLYLADELYTQGKYSYSFRIYIPNGFNGYFNVLQDHDLTLGALWGMQAFFDVNGIGTLDAGGYGSATFLYDYDEWLNVEVVVDLDVDWAAFNIDGEQIHEWQWSTGISGTGGWNTLEGGDFYAWNSNNTCKYYMDEFQLIQLYDNENELSYNVYKDGDLMGSTSVTEYQDDEVAPGYHNYCVTAVYDEGESEEACDHIMIFSAPENFTALVENENDVMCSWEEIVSASLEGYQVYRDDEMVSGLITDTEWMDEDLDGGTHNYYVTAVYNNGESLPSNIETVIILITPMNLVATPNGENIELEWEGVGNVIAGNLVELYQHDDNPVNGLYQWFDFGYGVVFDISAYEGATIETVDFHHSSFGITGTWSYIIHVVDMTTYEEIDWSGPFQTTGNDTWEVDIELGSVPSSSNLIGIFLEPMSNDPQDAYPVLSLDEELNGNSLTVSLDDYTLSDFAIGDFLLNLWIFAPVAKKTVMAPKAVVDNSMITSARNEFEPVKGEIAVNQTEKSSKALIGYNVYYAYDQADFDYLDNTIDTTYVHEGMGAVNGLHKYYVTSAYEEGESGPSNIEIILIDGIENLVNGSELVYPNPFTDEINIQFENNIYAVKVINSSGQVILWEDQINNEFYKINLESQPTGIYNIRIESENGWINRKVIKK
jgi:hypothetical protein